MTEPYWKPLATGIKVPTKAGVPWTRILDVAPVDKLIKIEVIETDTLPSRWKPEGLLNECTPDGSINGVLQSGGQLLPSAPLGALIGKIGGSTADLLLDTSATTATRLIFSVGRHCVLRVPASPAGSLFLGVNDRPELMAKLGKELLINVYEAG